MPAKPSLAFLLLLCVVLWCNGAVGQVAAIDWLVEQTTVSGHVNLTDGGFAGDLAVNANNSEVIIVGNCSSIGTPVYFSANDSVTSGLFIASYNTGSGGLNWVRNFGENGSVRPNSLGIDDEGNMFILGDFGHMRYGADSLVSNWATDMFIAKHDHQGNLLWIRQMGSPSYNNVEYDDTSIDLVVGTESVYIHVETHGNFLYEDSVVTYVGSPMNMILRVDPSDGTLMNHATIDQLHWPSIAVNDEGEVFTYCTGSVSSVNGVVITQNPDARGQFIKLSEDLELERIVDLNLRPAFLNLISSHQGKIVLGGTITAMHDSVLVDGVAVHELSTSGLRWLLLAFDENGHYAWASDESSDLALQPENFVISAGQEIMLLSSGGQATIYDSNGNHLLNQTITTGQMEYRNAVVDAMGGSLYLYSNYSGNGSLVGQSISSAGGTADAFLAKLKYSSPNSVINYQLDNGLSIYPNPTKGGWVTVQYDLKNEEAAELMVFDVVGRRVYLQTLKQVQGDGSVAIDVASWPSGVYNCTLLGNGQLLHAQKLVLLR